MPQPAPTHRLIDQDGTLLGAIPPGLGEGDLRELYQRGSV